MKQHITPKQFDELGEKGKEKYCEWYQKVYAPFADDRVYIYEDENGASEYTAPPLSIGQMIEFLGDEMVIEKEDGESWKVTVDYDFWEKWGINWHLSEELCDALWEAVKEVLEK